MSLFPTPLYPLDDLAYPARLVFRECQVEFTTDLPSLPPHCVNIEFVDSSSELFTDNPHAGSSQGFIEYWFFIFLYIIRYGNHYCKSVVPEHPPISIRAWKRSSFGSNIWKASALTTN